MWIPPFPPSMMAGSSASADLEARNNPLSRLLDGGDTTLSLNEFSAHPDGSRQLVQLLNMSLEGHLYQAGLFVDKIRALQARAYFPKEEDGPSCNYLPSPIAKKASRTVVKARISNRTDKVLVLGTSSRFSYRFEQLRRRSGF